MKALGRHTTKLFKIYGMMHPKSDIDRLYIPRSKGGTGLVSCEMCIKTENNLGWYVKYSLEPMLIQVKENGVLKTKDCTQREDYKRKKTS